MKRLAVLAAVTAIFSAVMAFGGVQDFGKFTVDVPEGWTAKQDVNGVFISKNGTDGKDLEAVSLSSDSANGHSAKEIADAFVWHWKDTFPLIFTPEVDEHGYCEWYMVNSDGVKIRAVLGVEGEVYVLIMMSGLDTAAEEIEAILSSVRDK